MMRILMNNFSDKGYKKVKKKGGKKKWVVLLIIITYLLLASFTTAAPLVTNNGSDAEGEAQLGTSIDDILNEIDTDELDAFLNSLTNEQKELFGNGNVLDKLKLILSGEITVDYGSFMQYIFSMLGIEFLRYAPVIISILAIGILYNILSSIKGKFSSDSVQNIVYFACASLIVVILITQVFGLITDTKQLVQSLQRQISLFFPIILTLMTAVGAGTSVAVYQPAVAVLSSGMAELITALILPAFIIGMVFTIVGNLTEGVKLKGMSGFFTGATKWLMGTSFFLFGAFLSVQGITASVYDGISVRTAKFAISKYVPIIGGYLSEGLNLIMAGGVLVKNALGMTAVIVLVVSIIPMVLKIIIFSLSLSFTAAILEPLGDHKMSGMVGGIAKNISILVAIVLGIAFLYFIFLILVICTGNLVL